jgi:hypothetical protein
MVGPPDAERPMGRWISDLAASGTARALPRKDKTDGQRGNAADATSNAPNGESRVDSGGTATSRRSLPADLGAESPGMPGFSGKCPRRRQQSRLAGGGNLDLCALRFTS